MRSQAFDQLLTDIFKDKISSELHDIGTCVVSGKL